MLVDLGRNDVGRVAQYGTVRAELIPVVERYSHVLHLVSQVEGELPRRSSSAIDAFRATFPAGTMTGAPKVRAMEIIDELEPERRGPYAGAVGYIARRGHADGPRDHDPDVRHRRRRGARAGRRRGSSRTRCPTREWEETESKARAMLTAIGQVRH